MLKILERLAIYAVTRIIFIVLIGLLLIISGLTAFNLSNIYITVNEAMDRQAQVVLDDAPVEQLNEYFTPDYLNNEFFWLQKQYQPLDVVSYEHSVKIHISVPMPWSKDAYVVVEDSVTNIKLVEHKEDKETAAGPAIPEWNNMPQRLHLVREEGRWKINNVVK